MKPLLKCLAVMAPLATAACGAGDALRDLYQKPDGSAYDGGTDPGCFDSNDEPERYWNRRQD